MSPLPTILVVGHDPVVCRAIEESLDRIGFESVTLNSSAKAVEWLNQFVSNRAVLALIDIGLPGDPDAASLGHHCHTIYQVPFFYLATTAAELQDPRVLESQPHGYILRDCSDDELCASLTLASESLREREASPAATAAAAAQVVTPTSDSEANIVTDLTGRITYLNTLAEDLTGWSLAEANQRPYQEVFRLVDAEGKPQPHEPLAARSDRSAHSLVTLARRDGQTLPIRERTASLTHGDGSLAGLFIAFDPSRDRPASPPPPSSNGASAPVEEADDRATSRYAAMLDAITDPLFAMDRFWRVTYANQPAEQLLERSRQNLMGKNFWEEFPNSDHAKHYEEYAAAAAEQRPCVFEFFHEPRGRWLEAHAYPFPEGLLVFLRDITDRRKAQKRASKLDKLESLGLLARGFAHDFNNLLTVLLGNVSLARYARPGEEGYHQPLDAAKHATEQARNLVQQLLTFAKGGAPITDTIDVNQDIIREVLSLHKRQPHIEYQLQMTQESVIIDADPGQIRRLLANLLKNAEEAMLAGGKLRLSSHLVKTDDPLRAQLPASLDPKTEYALLEVHDTGEGIPDVHLDKIFEPYFSTRSNANATGLGLTVCDSIARSHKGFLAIDSRYGSHTTARLFLPTVRQDWHGDAKQPEATLPTRRPVNNPPRVLILDDEKPIRVIMTLCLKKDGYEVVDTAEGSETVAAYLQALEEGRCFDLVIMDLSIPNGMGGAEAIQQIRYADPEAVAVVSSGYSDDPVMANFAQYGFSAVLPKPYEPSSLRQLAHRLITGEEMPD